MKKQLLLIFGLCLVGLIQCTNLFAYPIISKEMNGCSRNNRCSNTSKQLCDYEGSEGTITGWCISCSGAGFTKCPNTAMEVPGSDLDLVDMQTAEDLMDFVDEKVEHDEVYSGNHSITVFNVSDNTLRKYTVIWNLTLDENDELTGNISIDKLILPSSVE